MNEIRVRVDMSKCDGRGMCFDTGPLVFLADRYGYPLVQPFDQSDHRTRASVYAAVAACPKGAIVVTEVAAQN